MKWLAKLMGLTGLGTSGDLTLIDGVTNHVTSWIGQPTIFHERISLGLHIDVYWVPASEERPFHTLVTSGMAERPLTLPDGTVLFVELLMFVDKDWPMDKVTTDEKAFWPIQVLKAIASYPHDYNTWVGPGHTIELGELSPSEWGFSTVLIYYPVLLDIEGAVLNLSDGREVKFLSAVLLRPEERDFDMEQGEEALMDRAESQGLTNDLMILTPGRRSVEVL